LIALSNLHTSDIIHGDLKPENILLSNKSKNIDVFIQKMNIEKIIKNKNLMKEQKTRNKILEEIKKHIEKIDINLEYDSSCESDGSMESDEEIDICSDDSVSVTYSLDSSSDDELSNHSHYNNDNLSNEVNFSIKIADMGGCVLPNQKRKKQIQTCYYMSPEILLRLPYNNTSDMWSLACSLYEIMTGKILFDPDNYDGNEDRLHLYLITKSLGNIPDTIINQSRYKDVFFTQNYKRIRGFKLFEHCNLKEKIHEKIKYDDFDLEDKIIADKFLEFFFQCLEYDINKRITSINALKFDIFA
jgi:serine/threonine protein kinase